MATVSPPFRCSVPVVDVPYDALQKDLGKTVSCQKLRVVASTPASGYTDAPSNWISYLTKKDTTAARCTSSRVTGKKVDKALEDERRLKEVTSQILSCVHLQAVPNSADPGKGVVYNPFSTDAVVFGGVPTNPDIRPLFDVRKCVTKCGAVTRSSSRSNHLL